MRVVLCVMVKDEARVIERCLTSALPLIDAVSACDTGSTDATVARIAEFGRARGKPVHIYHHEWSSFGVNRTRAFEACRGTCETLGYDPADAYALLLDADMVCAPVTEQQLAELRAELSKADRAQGYELVQRTSMLAYRNTRLVRLSAPWRSVGVTHECWECSTCPLQDLGSIDPGVLMLLDHGDGGCKSSKFQRDIALLERGLAEEPDNARYMFYLAQSYRDVVPPRDHDAVAMYKRHVATDSWDEERWFSKTQIGVINGRMGNPDEMVKWLLAAHECRPTRAEPMWHLAQHYRHCGQHNTALVYAQAGLQIPFPGKDRLFVRHDVHEYLLLFEVSVSAYYTPLKAAGRAACERLLSLPGQGVEVPDAILRVTRDVNLPFYADVKEREG